MAGADPTGGRDEALPGRNAVRAVLFTDLTDSTGALERLGDEAAERARRRHYAQMSDLVADHEGVILKELGDGLSAAFTSALQSVRCAIAMQRADRDATGERRLRIGIEIGEPYEDEHGDLHGMPVVVARRLCDTAGPAEILVSDVVARLVARRLPGRLADMGHVRLKGLRAPTALSQVQWHEEVPAEPPHQAAASAGPALPRPLMTLTRRPLLGRDAELQTLLEQWRSTCDGEASLRVLLGDAGAGKSRLTAEVAAHCAADGGTVLYGECDADTALFLQPWSEALSRDCDRRSTYELRHLSGGSGELVRLVPVLRSRVPDLPAPVVVDDPEGQRGRLYDAILRYLTAAAEAAPLLVVLEDLHWADKGTLELLGFLHRRLDTSRVMILATVRQTEVGDRLHSLLTDLARHDVAPPIRLAGLPIAAIAELARVTLGAARVSDELVDRLREHTDGNALFVEELLRSLAHGGSPIESLEVPPTVEATLDRALHLLTPDAVDHLVVAAVAGSSFELSVLARAADVDSETLLDQLELAAARRLIVEDPATPGEFAFAHALVRKVLLGRIGPTRLARIHLKLGQALEEISAAGRHVDPAELARHLLAAGPSVAARASVHAEAAGRVAMERLGYAQAADFFAASVTALDTSDGASGDRLRRARLLVLQGQATTRAGRVAEAAEIFHAALREARVLRDPQLAADVARGISGGWAQPPGAPYPDLIEALQLSVELLDDDDPMRVHLDGLLAAELRHELSADDRDALTLRALEQARTIGDPRLLAEAIIARHWVFLPHPDPAARLALLDELEATAARVGDREALLQGLLRRHSDLKEAGDVAAATAVLRRYSDLATEVGQPFFVYSAALTHAAHLLTTGTREQAQAALDVAGGLFATVDARPQLQEALEAVVGLHLVLTGNHAAFVAATDGALRDNVGWSAGRAWALAESGRVEDSRALIASGAAHDFAPPGEALAPLALGLWARAAFAAGSPAVAPRLEERLTPYRGLWIQMHFGGQHLGPVLLHLGLLRSLQGDHDGGRTALAEAAEVARTAGSSHFVDDALAYSAEVARRADAR